MATIDVGKLTFTHKGDYSSSTAYVLNDVVYYNGSAYIAKTSTTGNLPTSTAHWNLFSAGSGGIWNSGLSIGTAGQVVKVNSGANALEFGAAGGGLESIQTFTSSGTYTKPSGITKIRVYVTGGGGGGGGTSNSGYNYQSGTGGGAGGTAIKLLDATSITTVTVTIGSGGVGSSNAAGTNGSTSSFGSHATATGGTGGVKPGAFNYAVPGGSGSGGDINLRGGAGGGAIEDNAGAVWGGDAGQSYWGGDGAPQWSGTAGTTQAGVLGGGGAGASHSAGGSKAGGNGGDGYVVVEEYK